MDEGKTMDTEYVRRLPALKRLVLGSVVFGLVLAAVTPAVAQGGQPAAPSPTPIPAPTPLPASQIPARVGEVAALLRGFEAHVQPRDEIGEVREKLPEIGEAITSLDFEFRAWTRGDFVSIASDLRVGIDTTLAENGIEIPFPQRDLHVRTVDRRAAARLSGESTGLEADGSSAPTTGSAGGDDPGGVTS